MSISSSTRKAGPFACNGSTVAFPFAFKVFTTADVRVVLTDSNGLESDLVLGTNYTVALNADQDANPGGTVTTTATYATGYLVTLTSRVKNLQPVTLTNQGGFYPKIINDALDRAIILIQQLAEAVSRSLKTAISTPSGVNPQLPAPVPYALIGWNATGDGFQNADPSYANLLSIDLASTAAGKGGALVGFKQSESGAVARTVHDKLHEVVSVKDFGAVGDGVTDDTAAFQAAIDSFNAIGGQLKVPASVYRIDGTVTGRSNIHLAFESGAVIDGSHTATGPVFLFAGTTGASVNLGVNATRGDTSLTTAADHGLVTGDWFLLVSQRDCLSPDAGDWRLGSTGPTSSREYFGEAKQVATAPTSTTLTMREGLTFPDYRTDLTQETEVTSTHVAYLQKINFLAGVKITGGKFIVRGDGTDGQRVAVKLLYCLYPEVSGIEADLGSAPGRCIMSSRCFGGTFEVGAYRTPGWNQDPYPGLDHNVWNSFVDSSGWYNRWKISDINGGQGLDVTYTSYVEPFGYQQPYIPPIGISVTGRTINNRENSVTWHWGGYQGLIHDMVSINSGGEGIFVRSKMVDIANPYVVNTGAGLFSSQAGIYIQGWATDLSITGGTIQGYPYGVLLEQIGNAVFEQGPEVRNVRINGATISNCTKGIYLGNYRSRNTNILSGIWVSNCAISDCDYGLFSKAYVNGVYATGMQFTRMRENSRLFFYEKNSYGHSIQNVRLCSSPESVLLLEKDDLTDTTTFSGASYLNNQINYDFGNLLQSLNPRNISGGSPGPKILSNSVIVPEWLNGKPLIVDGVNLALTIPKVTSGVPVIPPTAQIDLINMSSTPVTIMPESGVTLLVKSSHTKIMPYGKVTIRCRYGNNWVMFGDTQA